VAALNVTPVGSTAAESLKTGVGEPVPVTVNVPVVPITKVALLGLLMDGAFDTVATVSVNVCVTSGPTPLCKVKFIV
jgi:hypothetical protein